MHPVNSPLSILISVAIFTRRVSPRINSKQQQTRERARSMYNRKKDADATVCVENVGAMFLITLAIYIGNAGGESRIKREFTIGIAELCEN